MSPACRKVARNRKENTEKTHVAIHQECCCKYTYGSTQFNDTNVSRTCFSINWYHCHTFYPLLNGICDVRNNLEIARVHERDELYMQRHGKKKDKVTISSATKEDLDSFSQIISPSFLINNSLQFNKQSNN